MDDKLPFYAKSLNTKPDAINNFEHSEPAKLDLMVNGNGLGIRMNF
jgi:hypothetical protein